MMRQTAVRSTATSTTTSTTHGYSCLLTRKLGTIGVCPIVTIITHLQCWILGLNPTESKFQMTERCPIRSDLTETLNLQDSNYHYQQAFCEIYQALNLTFQGWLDDKYHYVA